MHICFIIKIAEQGESDHTASTKRSPGIGDLIGVKNLTNEDRMEAHERTNPVGNA